MQFLDPCNDVAFKKIFGSENHKNITISFLNSILECTGDKLITSIQFLNTEQHPMIHDIKKENILDVMCVDQAGRRYIVEIQVRGVKEFGRRMVYYGAKTYALQLGKGMPYYKLAPVIVLAIVDFEMFPQKKAYKSRHLILDDVTHEQDLDALAFVFVELKKFKKQESELVSIEDQWIYFLKEIQKKTEIPDHLSQEDVREACHVAERLGWSEWELSAYEDAFVRATDAEGEIAYAREKGEAKGLEKGVEQVAIALLQSGMDTQAVAQLTGLSISKVKDLKSRLK